MAGTAFWRQATLAFAAGPLGGFVLFVFFWMISMIGIPHVIGSNFTADLPFVQVANDPRFVFRSSNAVWNLEVRDPRLEESAERDLRDY